MRLRTSLATLVAVATAASALMVGVKGETPIDPSGKWSPVAAMNSAREFASSALLPDGSVLVFGGRESGAAGAGAERFTAGAWSSAGASPVQRWGQTATMLADGTVIIAGGTGVTSVDEQGQPVTAPTAAIERFDPSTGELTPLGFLSGPRTGHAATRLADGRVLFAGGFDGNTVVADVEILDPETGLVSPGPADLEVARAGLSATTLMNGRVLLAGGNDGVQDLALVDIYDAEGGILTSSEMSAPRRDHQAVLLAHNNQVLLIGGASNGQVAGAELYRPWTGTFLPTGSPAVARVGATAVTLATEWPYRGQEGQALVVGGAGAEGHGDASAESYTFATIRTDKDDYAPGETVYLSGTGWQPNETITLGLQELPLEHESRSFTIQADEFGRVNNVTLFLVEPHHLGIRFYLTARGAASQAQVTFTDGNVNVRTVGAPTAAMVNWARYTNTTCSGTPANSGTIVAILTGNGGGIPGGAGDENSLLLTAQPVTGHSFSHWSGDISTAVPDSSNSTCVIGRNNTRQIQANYTVGKADQAVVTVSAPATATYQQAGLSATAQGGSGTGAYSFSNGTSTACTVNSTTGALTITSGTGTCAITATRGGDANYNPSAPSAAASVTIGKANATISVTGYTGVYDGQPHGASGTATGVGGVTLPGLSLGATFTNVPGGTANWTFTGGTNYNDANGTAAIVISKANATVTVDGYTGVYDAQPHGATGSAKGIGDVILAGLDLGATFTNVPGGTATWTFTDVTGNYNNASGTAAIVITKANATVTVDGYNGVYDGTAHGATGTAKGILSEPLAGLTLGASFTNVPGGTANWSFTDTTGNYNHASGTAAIVISKANATVSVSGYSGVYDGTAHGATGTATGVGGADLTVGLSLGATFINAPGGTAHWTFAGGTNYNDQAGDATITISKADATVSVSGYTGVYDGQAHGATGTATGVGGADLTVGLSLGGTFTNAPGGTAHWTFAGGTNYNDEAGDASITINKANATVSVSGYTGVYDGSAHGATGTAKGVLDEPLAGLNLGASFTNVPGGIATWTFTDATGNYNNATGSAAIAISKADAAVSVNGYTGVYDGSAHGATGTAKGVLDEPLTGLNLGVSFTNVPGGTANWAFTDATGNYNDASGTAAIVITKADAMVTVNGYTGVYDGAAHGATGTATGIGGVTLSGLTLGDSFTNVPGGTANWAFTDATGNYNDASGTAAIVITKADAMVTVNGYTGVYDGAAHGATGTATGIGGVTLSGLTLGDSFTNVPGGTANWTFTDATGNYNDASGTAAIVITKADAMVTVTGYTGVYDSATHGATGTATGIGGVTLSGLTLGDSFTNVPGGTAHWAFTDVTGNYNNASGTAAIAISKADAAVIVNGYTGVYDGATHGATGTATGIGGVTLSGLTLGDSFTNVPGGTANWAFNDVTGNYNNANGTAAIVISKAEATVIVNGYTGVYDGAAHGATGTAKGVLDEPLTGLSLGASFTNAPGGTATWTFTDSTGNYKNASGTAAIVISKANAMVTVNGYTGVYDAQPHGATGTATGIGGVALAGLDLGAKFTNVPGGTATWTFTDATGNYNSATGTAAVVISKRTLTVTPEGGKTKTLGDVFTAFTGTVVGLQGTDTGTATYASLGAPAAALVGSYDITSNFAFTSGAQSNYDVQPGSALKGLKVLYRWDGFLQPINDTAHDLGPMSKFKAGQTIPAKFVLMNAAGAVVQQTGIPQFTRSNSLGACDLTAALENVELIAASVQPLYQWDGSQYHYNWSTKGLQPGLYRIFANLADGTAQSVDICLTK